MTTLVALVFALATSASAREAKVYVNGERADGLRDVVLEDVSVRFDERGNLWITAPQYVVGGTSGESAHEPAPPGQWWLYVTDSKSVGVAIQVSINGRVATVVKSGQGGGSLDLAPWLHRGANQIVLSAEASEAVDGGPLKVEIGRGAAASKLESVDVSFARDPAAAGRPVERSFVLRVP